MVREKKIVQQQKRPHWRSEKKAKIFFAVYRWKEPVHLVEKPTEGQYKMFTTPYLTCGWLHDSFASTIAALISFDLFFKCLLRCSSASHSCISFSLLFHILTYDSLSLLFGCNKRPCLQNSKFMLQNCVAFSKLPCTVSSLLQSFNDK